MKKKINILLTIIIMICITISLTACDFTSLEGDWESDNGFIFTFNTDKQTIELSIDEDCATSDNIASYKTIYILSPNALKGSYTKEKNNISAKLLGKTLRMQKDGDVIDYNGELYYKQK